MKSQTIQKLRLRNYLLVSIGVHLLFLAATTIVSKLSSAFQNQRPVEVVLLDQVPESNKDIKPDTAKQVVETDSANANQIAKDDAKYHSEKNNSVEKETKAKSGETFKNALRQGAKTVQAQKGQQKTAKAADLLNPTFDPYAAMVKRNPQLQNADYVPGQTGAQIGDSSTTTDRLDAKDDLITRLNTKEYKYYGYYHRIKQQLNQWWQPKVREKVTRMVSQGRTIASEENKTTKLIIILNNAGQLVKVQVLAESGVRDLDDAAVEAFRAAAPFPNPPQGIIENDGTVRIRWDFVVES